MASKNQKGLVQGTDPAQAAGQDVQEAEPVRATDKIMPGGLYIVEGKVVDANGKPLLGWSVVNGQAVKDE